MRRCRPVIAVGAVIMVALMQAGSHPDLAAYTRFYMVLSDYLKGQQKK